MTKIENHRIPNDNHENLENNIIPRDNHESMEIIIF